MHVIADEAFPPTPILPSNRNEDRTARMLKLAGILQRALDLIDEDDHPLPKDDTTNDGAVNWKPSRKKGMLVDDIFFLLSSSFYIFQWTSLYRHHCFVLFISRLKINEIVGLVETIKSGTFRFKVKRIASIVMKQNLWAVCTFSAR